MKILTMAHHDTIGYYFYSKGVADLSQDQADKLKAAAMELSKSEKKKVKYMSSRGGMTIPIFNSDILDAIFKDRDKIYS